MTKKLRFETTHELAEYLIDLAEYIKSLPNMEFASEKSNLIEVENKRKLRGDEKIRLAKEKFEKEIEGRRNQDEVREILSNKKKKELIEIARGYNISSTVAKNTRKDELVNMILDNLRFTEKFEKLRKNNV